ncbi:hypothetical protein [Streptomyces albireticuli]|uniref:Uncharacterized protein n=1 Tax=Streptomyces albireticuli TaxID=1940 RepID=A0A2A2CZC7_9ACTN|nr:hypothetical protein [Streptomyces albireticuli]MCD9141551.1 hypothetical protein [Streptomyces albireticuli]MCD9164198.1 hypothetical protein [Streptomyces albireticuli]MCD9189725.1 hypothetical protein [Streptomyces albireticuli]PAU44615.1 hypothetical protein CK936_34000 [Streptomyces albireticuli]
MARNGGAISVKVDTAHIIELSKNLENVDQRTLRRAIRAITLDSRLHFRGVVLGNVVMALGHVISGALVLAYLWVGYQMVLRDHAGLCVVLCGLPVTSVASIFMLKKVPATHALGALGRRVIGLLGQGQGPGPGQGGGAI